MELSNKWWQISNLRLPKTQHFEYVYGRCKDKENLALIIKKAHAKIFECYEALNGELIDDALTDSAGKVVEKNILGSGTYDIN